MEKEEKIAEAYGKHWDALGPEAKKCAIKHNGWISSLLHHAPKDLDLDFNQYTFRPKSLQGIDNNNGWVKIHRESELPQFDCDCFIMDKNGDVFLAGWKVVPFSKNDKLIQEYWYANATHYKIISKPKLPIY